MAALFHLYAVAFFSLFSVVSSFLFFYLFLAVVVVVVDRLRFAAKKLHDHVRQMRSGRYIESYIFVMCIVLHKIWQKQE